VYRFSKAIQWHGKFGLIDIAVAKKGTG